MIGHGCPRNERSWGFPAETGPLAVVIALLGLLIGDHAGAAEPWGRHVRLQWSAEQPTHFQLRLEATDGRFAAPQNLTLDAASTGAFLLSENDRVLSIQPHGRSERGGVDLRVVGGSDATISVTSRTAADAVALAAAQAGPPVTVRVTELGDSREPLKVEGGLQLWIQATPGEAIRADFGRDALVFDTGEKTPLRIRVGRAAIGATENLGLRMQIRRARGGSVVAEKRWPLSDGGSHDYVEVDAGMVQMPTLEDAYDIEFACVRSVQSNLPLFPENVEIVVRRTVQIVVVKSASQPAASGQNNLANDSAASPVDEVARERDLADSRPMKVIGRIDPFGKSWSMPRLVPGMPEALSGVSKLLASETAAIASGPLEEEQHAGEKVAVLAPGGWYAHPLPITQRDRPHVVVVRYPIGKGMRLGVSVVQQDAAGNVAPLGTDSGLATDLPIDVNPKNPWGEHRLVFWPHCDQPYIVLANHDTSEPARFASIHVEAGPESLAPASTLASPRPHPQEPAAKRLAALYLDKPLLAECFGDGGALDPASGAVLEDWVTFLKAAQRLADYLKWAGFNGAIVTVSSEGGTLYPTERFAATPRFDNGAFSATGRDPLRKDVLELLLRVFDREGLRLVPAVELATPLPELERLRGDVDAFLGVEPIDATGRSLLTKQPPRRGLAPYYNPLDGRVQEQLTAVVAELGRRYGHHRAFEGIGMHLGPQTYLQLPPAEWCRDTQTMTRFAAAHSDAPEQIDALQRWIDGPGRDAFVQWRAAEMTRLYANLARSTGGKRLLLLTSDSTVPVDTHLTKGLDWSQLSALENVVPMRLLRESIFRDAVQQSRDARANENLDWDQTLAPSPVVGGLVFRPPAELKIAGFADKAPVAAGAARTRWFAHAVPTGARYRRQITGLMDQMDPQILAVGGWTAPLGQEHQLRETLRTFASLPATAMRPVLPPEGRSSNVRVRQVTIGSRTIVSVVNMAPWSVDIEVSFANAVTLRPLRNETASPVSGEAAGDLRESRSDTAWRVTVPSGALAAVEADGGSPVRDWKAEPTRGSELVQQLTHRTRELAGRVALLSNPRPYPVLPNGGFEQDNGHGAIPGWLHAQHPADSVQIVNQGYESEQSVRLANTSDGGAKTWIVSGQIQPPPTGRLAVSLQVRALSDQGAADETAMLRVAIEGWAHGMPIRRDVVLRPPTNGRWQEQPMWLEVEDIGTEEAEQLRLTIDLLSPGEVWVDDVRLYDFFLTETERSELQSRAFLAIERLRKGNLTPAAKLFDSHWGRYLMALRVQTPGDQGKITQEIRNEPVEGIADRLRKWLPTPTF